MPVPAFLLLNNPVAAVTTSLPNNPVSVPPVNVAAVVPSYTLLLAVKPVTVKLAGVMSPYTPCKPVTW